MQQILRQISPQTILAAVFALSIFLFSLVTMLPSLFYHTLDPASYLVFHNSAELFATIVCLSIFGVGWYTFDQSKNRHALFLSGTFLGIGLVAFMHTLSFPGMPQFVTPNSTNKAIQFWLAFRLYYAGAFLASAYVYPDSGNPWLSKTNLLLFSIAVSILVFTGVIYCLPYLPIAFIEGRGLTPFKTFAEYAIIALFGLSLVAYWSRFSRTHDKVLMYYMSALVLSIFSELAFTLYQSAFDTYNMLGHIYEVGAFYLIYSGIFAGSVRYPYERLEDTSKQLQMDLTERKRAENIMLARLRLIEYATSHSLDELLQATLDEVEALTDSLIGFYHFLEADQRTLRLQAWSTRTLQEMCTAEGKGLHYDIDEAGVWVDCVRERKPVIHNDYSALPHRRGMPAGHANVTRELVVPVFRSDRIVAILGVGNKAVDYNASDIETVSLLADLAWDIAQRKLAEEALQAANAYNRSLIEASLDPLVTISAHGKITDVNRATELVTGHSRDELIGTDFAVYFADPQKARDGYQRAFEEGVVKDYELEIRNRNGDLTPVVYNASVYHDPSGEIGGLFAAARDISGRKQAEERNALLAAIVESSDDAIIGKALDGIITSWNKGAASIYGYQDVEALGKPISLLVPPERQDEVSQLLERIKRGEHVERYETVRLKKDGSEINVSLTISPIRNAQGRITGASTIARDVTQRKRAEEALRESEEKYRTLFEESFDGLFITSPGGRILDMNKKGVAMFGYDTKEEIMSLDLERDVYAHPPDRRRILSMVNAQGSAEYEVVVKKKSAEHMITHCSLAAVRDEKDVITSYRGIIRDITERKRAEEELNQYRRHLEDLVTERTQELEERTRELETANMRLREADRLKSVFLASMSHELRTPLNSIIGFTGIMLMGMAGKLNEEQERQLTMVKNGANHLLGLINDLLDIAKIEAGRVTLSLERFELEEVVDSVIETVSPMAEGKGLLLVRDIPSGLALFSDKRRVKQILMNIIGNAVKFTEHGSIKIAVGVLGDKNVELRFTDTGIGIKQENMKVLFSPFQQIDTSLTKAYEGTGLGLYLSKRLASLLGGDITASSTYGKGSEFTVVLPLAYGGPHEKKDTGG